MADIYKLFCFFQGLEQPSPVNIAKTETVGDLKEAIWVKNSDVLPGIKADRLILYQVDVSGENPQERNDAAIAAIEKLPPLDSLRKLSSLYPDGPGEGMIHITARLPTKALKGPKRKASSEMMIDSVAYKRRQVVNDLTFSKYSPSTLAQGEYKRLDPDKYVLNRPPVPETVPLAILNPIFGQFMDEMDAHIPTAADNALVRKLREVMSTTYDNERDYCHEFRDAVMNYYPDVQFTAAEIGNTQYTSDGHLSEGKFMYAVTEAKTWNGSGDPEVQAASYYVRSVGQWFKQGDYPDRLPCMVVYFVGPLVCFAGAVLTDRLQLETFVPPLVMHTNLHEDKMAGQAARTLGAFRHALQKLRVHYRELAATNPPKDSGADMDRLIFPYQSHFTDTGGNRVEFTYIHRFLDNKLMFIAKAGELDVLIKFTRRYSEDAHRFCDKANIAPKLYAVERLAGGWMMIVMEYLDSAVYENLSFPPDPLLLQQIKQVVQTLHSGGFVHGDIRGPNVMVNTDTRQVMLVDFDWAGLEGEVRYPPNLNTKVLPIGVTDGESIKKEHDTKMISYLGIF